MIPNSPITQTLNYNLLIIHDEHIDIKEQSYNHNEYQSPQSAVIGHKNHYLPQGLQPLAL